MMIGGAGAVKELTLDKSKMEKMLGLIAFILHATMVKEDKCILTVKIGSIGSMLARIKAVKFIFLTTKPTSQ